MVKNVHIEVSDTERVIECGKSGQRHGFEVTAPSLGTTTIMKAFIFDGKSGITPLYEGIRLFDCTE